ncbi:MAG: polymerase subunit delta [Desulfovibrionales bacterium]|jgi:DNA polymerase-3 subunit delta'|nr:polymerase subunit delta [Desulfovibrionales bacterium]
MAWSGEFLAAVKRQQRTVGQLGRLRHAPPQSLLLEGGCAADRRALALYWAAALNCGSADPPCLNCQTCGQIADMVHLDLVALDGASDTIKIDQVRELRPVWGQPPRGGGVRVTILFEAQNLTTEAANALLKSLEEPRPGNAFVLLAPQRERLLPTLVSRSFTLGLAWPGRPEASEDVLEWLDALLSFWETGRGWFDRTLAKGALSPEQAGRLLVSCQGALAGALAGEAGGAAGKLANAFSLEKLRRLHLALEEAQEALGYRAAPALVFDWLAASMRRPG